MAIGQPSHCCPYYFHNREQYGSSLFLQILLMAQVSLTALIQLLSQDMCLPTTSIFVNMGSRRQ